jgi:hypothetical protein
MRSKLLQEMKWLPCGADLQHSAVTEPHHKGHRLGHPRAPVSQARHFCPEASPVPEAMANCSAKNESFLK